MSVTEPIKAILLPGMDGTGKLFSRFVDELPSFLKPVVVDYPNDVLLDYTTLMCMMPARLGPCDDAVIIAESFSGPLAVRIGSNPMYQGLRGIVLVNSFVTAPISSALSWLPWRVMFRVPPPTVALKHMLMNGPCATPMKTVCEVVASVPADVLAFRVQMVARVDVSDELKNTQIPVMFLNSIQDRVVPRRCLDHMVKLRPDARVAEIDGPHLLLQSRPQAAWQAMLPFLQTLAKRA